VRGGDFRKIVRLTVIAGFGLIVLVLDDLHLGDVFDVVLTVVMVVLWAVLLADLIELLVRYPDRKATLRSHLGYPLLLAAPFFIGPDLQWAVLLLLLVGYLLELRDFAAGRAFVFSFGLVIFVAAASTLAMVLVERTAENSKLRDVGEASAWVLSTLLRLPGFRPQQPVTQDGRLLGLVVGVCAVLAASFLTAQLVTWVVGSQSNHAAEDEAAQAHLAALTTELASLRACVDELTQRLPDPSNSTGAASDPGGQAEESTRAAPT
jgi:hypothetical protein